MKKYLAIGLTASFLVGLSAYPAHADYYFARKAIENSDTAMKNERRADNQVFKADRAAARGDGYKAEKHFENANRDEFKVRKDEHRAFRDSVRAY